MKKSFLYLAAALGLLACQTTPGVADGPDSKVLAVSASLPPASKTSYGEDPLAPVWIAGDRIAVLCNDGIGNFWQVFRTDTPGASATFTAEVASGVNMGPLGGGRKVALYPAIESGTPHVYSSASSIGYTIPAVQDFRPESGGHKESAVPLFAWGVTRIPTHSHSSRARPDSLSPAWT